MELFRITPGNNRFLRCRRRSANTFQVDIYTTRTTLRGAKKARPIRLFIMGSRNIHLRDDVMDHIISEDINVNRIEWVICGMSPGIDVCALNWARHRGKPVTENGTLMDPRYIDVGLIIRNENENWSHVQKTMRLVGLDPVIVLTKYCPPLSFHPGPPEGQM